MHKATANKRFDSRKLMPKAAENINSLNFQKCGSIPNAVKGKAFEDIKFKDIYSFIGS